MGLFPLIDNLVIQHKNTHYSQIKFLMKKILAILFIVFIYLPAISQDELSWLQRYWALSQQIANTEDEDKITKIAQQQINLLQPIYTNYSKDAYNDGIYGRVCINLIQAYILSGQYKFAKDIINASIKRIKDNAIKLRLNIEDIKITGLIGNYEKAELLSANIAPTISYHIADLQNYIDETEALYLINVVVNYDTAVSSLQTYYINEINNLVQSCEYQKAIDLLLQKKELFTSILLSNKTIDIINKNTNRISHKYSINPPLLKQEGRTDPVVYYYAQLALCYNQLGQYSAATRCYYWAEQHCLNTDSTSTYLIADNFLMSARFLRQIGNELRAEQYYSQCIGICAQSNDDNLIRTMNYAAMERAALIASWGAIDEAHETITMLIEYYLNKNQLYTIDFLDLLSCAISVAHDEKDYNEGLQLSKQALDIIPHIAGIKNPMTYTTKFRNALASSYIYLQQYENAITTINKIAPNNRTSKTYWIKGLAENKSGLYKNAIQSWQHCIQLHDENEPIVNRLNVYAALLATAIESNTPIETREMVDDFISQMNKVISVTTSMDLNKMLPVYQIYYELFLLYYSSFDSHNDIAYNLAISLKGVALKSMQDLKSRIYTTQNRNIIDKYENLLKFETELSQTTEINNIEILKNQIYNLEQSLLVELNRNPAHSYSWTNVKASLNRNTVAIEFVDYMISDSKYQYAALILRKDWDSPQMIPLCSKEELEQISRINLEDEKWRKNSYAQKDLDKRYFKKGYSLIWSKLEPYINEGDNVYFSPSGLLHQINVEVLKDSIGRQANEKYNLYRVSSTRQLCIEKPKVKYTNATLYGGLIYEMDSTQMIAQSRTYHSAEDYVASRGFVADSSMREGWSYLPATKSEVEKIARQMYEQGIRPERYTETVGTEESFKALSGKQIPIIHLATHGFFLKDEEARKQDYFQALNLELSKNIEDNSLKRSGLILSGGQRAWLNQPIPANVEDGILLAEEIATMDLSGTDLVVLSACQTGLGEITSEGVFGLQRAFKNAGVQTLIMSLWRVNDAATSLMMQTFYEHLLSGQSKREAFAIAQQAVKEKYNAPYYWAAFIMLD